jgi:hypothetical protein
MKKPLLTLLLLASIATLKAQTYQEKAQQIQKAVWDNNQPEFNTTEVPDAYAKESAVILAHSFTLEKSSKGRLKYFVITAGMAIRNFKTATLHERVKINDKAALENYSTLEYQKKLDKSVSLLIAKFVDNNQTFVGAKIIKPNGQEVTVNTGEEVLTKNTGKDQKGKLAIPDLQVGDILDYYISHYEMSESDASNSFKGNDYVIMLAEEYPVVNYSLDFRFDKKTQVKYILANGAPAFQSGTNADEDQLLSLKLKNVPKYQSNIWTSPYRQYPYIEISSVARQGTSAKTRLQDNVAAFEEAYRPDYSKVYKEYEKRLKEHFKGSKGIKAAPTDSVLNTIYNIWKYQTFCSYQANDLDDANTVNYRTAASKVNTILVSQLLRSMGIDHRILLVASRNTNWLDNVFNYEDFDALIRVDHDGQSSYMCFNDVVNHYNEIPAQYQGEKAVAINAARVSVGTILGTFSEGDFVLPTTSFEQNTSDEYLQVSLPADNMQKLKIMRNVKQTGYLRHGEQKRLLGPQEIDNAYTRLISGDDLKERLSNSSETKKLAVGFQEAFAKTSDRKASFAAEIKDQFDQEAQQLSDFHITNTALDANHPSFEYSSAFVLDNLVKKAGTNYIVDIGKLTGSFIKLDEKDKIRTIDVYMPAARTFHYSIAVNIPAGYQVKGVDELNKEKKNATGVFITTAAVKGNVLTIDVTRTYNHNLERAADWGQLVELMDSASDFNSQKILLEKQG